MAGAEPRDFCSQYPFGGEGFRPNAFACDFKANLHWISKSTYTIILLLTKLLRKPTLSKILSTLRRMLESLEK